MKITTGLYKYKKIHVISNAQLRPTSNKVRQALFNILVNRYNWKSWSDTANLLDAFSGSGIISIEAFSRNLHKATVIEKDKIIFDNLKKNFSKLNLTNKTDLINDNFFKVDLKKENYDIVYLDPPYNENFTNKAIEKILDENTLKSNSLLICETEKNYTYTEYFKKYILSSKNYGKTAITFFDFLLNSSK